MSPQRRRSLALVVLCLGQLMVLLDVTIVNVALPAIQADLGFSGPDLTWVVNSYLIAFGSFLLFAGRLGDLLGRKRVFLAGILVFAAASALCGLSSSPGMLIAARFLQGIGGALESAVIVAIIVTEFPGKEERARALGIFSFVAIVGSSIGLLAGGALTQGLSWHWIFLVNLPIGLLTFAAGLPLIGDSPGIGLRRGIDGLGSVLVTAGMMLLVYAIVGTESHGWLSAQTLLLSAGALALLGAFLLWQRHAATPTLPLSMLRSRNLVGGNVVRAFFALGNFSFVIFGALYFEYVLDYSPLQTGLAFIPMMAAIGAVCFLAPALCRRFGQMPILLAGLLCVFVGLVVFSRLPTGADYPVAQAPAFVLSGIGMGVAIVPLINLAMADAPPEHVGLASGLFNVSQQLGVALGTAVFGTIAASRTAALLDRGSTTGAALTAGYRLALGLAAAGLLLAIAISAFVLRPTDEKEVELGPEAAAARAEILADELI